MCHMDRRQIDEIVRAVQAKADADDMAGVAEELAGVKPPAQAARAAMLLRLEPAARLSLLEKLGAVIAAKAQPRARVKYFLTITSKDSTERPAKRVFKDPAKLVAEARELMGDTTAYDIEDESHGEEGDPEAKAVDLLFQQPGASVGDGPVEDPVEVVRRLGYGDVLKVEADDGNTWEVESQTMFG